MQKIRTKKFPKILLDFGGKLNVQKMFNAHHVVRAMGYYFTNYACECESILEVNPLQLGVAFL